MSRWCASLPPASLYPGICRVHQVEILDLRGAWEDAEAAASAACQDLVGIDVFAVADGHYAIGELLRRRGDAAAEEAYLRFHEAGGTRSRGSPSCGSPRGAWTPRLHRSTRRWSPASAAVWSGTAALGTGRHRLAAGDVGLADAAAAEVAEIAAEFERWVASGIESLPRRGQPRPRQAGAGAGIPAAGVRDVAGAGRAIRGSAYPCAASPRIGCSGTTTPPPARCAAARRVFARLRADPDLQALDASDAPPGGRTHTAR